eukprot:CAMPEP_0119310498 /NCGR_PEP_ID=MMETSP1333-20130426/19602_1 /TAXON_ID=418940 /ORGANISM="Scyphosphaera apsteinii, Strain RCC1455" /LENGTH=272 /DNA_ID=CAMNT_0007314691 /DNA_START=128 /DNA_END=943 /DNA_ORIENTATION=-
MGQKVLPRLNRTSCSVDRPRSGNRLWIAVITYISRTASRQCEVFLRYAQGQGISPSDVFIIAGLPVPNATKRCYSSVLPARNVQEHLVLKHNEGLKNDEINRLQTKLLLTGYSHTLALDPDEVVLPNPYKYRDLYDYAARNPYRGVVAPIGYEIVEIFSLDKPLDWDRPPLLQQRSVMVQLCAYSKPVFAQAVVTFSWGMHHISKPPYKACWGAKDHFDCQDPDLFLIHLKCLDMASAIANAGELADSDRGGNTTDAVIAYERKRCSDGQTW